MITRLSTTATPGRNYTFVAKAAFVSEEVDGAVTMLSATPKHKLTSTTLKHTYTKATPKHTVQ